MGDKLIFTSVNNKRCFCVLRDKSIRLFDVDRDTSLIGNIYVGRTANVMLNLNAAFVEYQKGIQGFMPVHKNADISVYKNEQSIPVQIKNDPIKTKEAVLSHELSLVGLYVIVTDTPGGIHFSKIFSKEQKSLLRQKLNSECVAECSYIMRTNAAALDDYDYELLVREIHELSELLMQIKQKVATRCNYTCLYDAHNFLKECLSKTNFSEVDSIVTDSKEEFDAMKAILPKAMISGLKLYEDSFPLYSLYELKKHLSDVTSRTVWLKSGGYLVVDYTEAMTIIDVNSGKNLKKISKDELAKITNEEASCVIPYLLSANNISGIVIVDFINVSNEKDGADFISILKKGMIVDPLKVDVVDVTALGLVEITRQKKGILLSQILKETNLYEFIKD